MLLQFPYSVYVRNQYLYRIGQVSDYTQLTAIPRYNSVGAFTLEISASSTSADLMEEGGGLVIRNRNGIVLSGPIRTVDWARSRDDGGEGKLTVGGVSDETILAEATCWPNPDKPIGQQTAPVYKLTGVPAETALHTLVNLNIGPDALLERQHPALTMGPDLGRGPLVTREVNQFDNLLTTLQDIAEAAKLGIRIVPTDDGMLEFQTYTPQDRSRTARFSFGLGNLESASYSTTPPTCTRAIVVAGGGSSPRVCKVYDNEDVVFHNGLVIEQFVDLTSVDTASVDLAAQMDQAAEEALTSGAGSGSLSITPIDLPNLRYGEHYGVGDTVAARLRGGTWWTDVVREVTLTAAADRVTTAATIGGDTSNRDVMSRIYSYIGGLKREVNRLKTRRAA